MEDRESYSSGQRENYGTSQGGGYGGRGRGGFGGPRPFKPAPVKVGEEFDVRIESMSKRGDAGVAKVEGLVIFVAGTKVGDSVKIRITRVGRGYATAEIASDTTSENAIEPSQDEQASASSFPVDRQGETGATPDDEESREADE
ncbi:MAG TPA: TRAM domain-containing protein [Candidatus Nitrosopolaris sp.]|nr:TRAM domain-containing protein [Candidatus Nitrosopolaris sp.]